MKDRKKIIYIGCAVAVVAFIGLLVFILSPKKQKDKENPDEIIDNSLIQEVEPEKAIEIYTNTADTCNGTLVWDLKPEDKIEIKDVNDLNTMGACQKENYYSKMIGYTYDLEGNLVVHTNVLKNVNGELRKLDDTVVAAYSEDTLDDSLNFGTTYEYIYKPDGENYTLIEVKLMELPPEE